MAEVVIVLITVSAVRVVVIMIISGFIDKKDKANITKQKVPNTKVIFSSGSDKSSTNFSTSTKRTIATFLYHILRD